MVPWLAACALPPAPRPEPAPDPVTTDGEGGPEPVAVPVEPGGSASPRPPLAVGDAYARAFFGVDPDGLLAEVVDPTSGAVLPPVVVVSLTPRGPGTTCVVALDAADAVVGGAWLADAELWYGFALADPPGVRSEEGCEPWRAAGYDPAALVASLGLTFGVGPAGSELGGHVAAVTDDADAAADAAVAYAWEVDPETMTFVLSEAGDYGYAYRQALALDDVPAAEGGVNPAAYEVIGLRPLSLR